MFCVSRAQAPELPPDGRGSTVVVEMMLGRVTRVQPSSSLTYAFRHFVIVTGQRLTIPDAPSWQVNSDRSIENVPSSLPATCRTETR